MFAILGKQVERIELAETRRIQITAKGLAIEKLDDDLFVGRGWGTEFQGRGFASRRETDLHIMELYVMLSAIFLSTYCF